MFRSRYWKARYWKAGFWSRIATAFKKHRLASSTNRPGSRQLFGEG